MESRPIVLAGALVAAAALGAGNYNVSERQLESLRGNARKVERKIGQIGKEFDERDVIPSANDRRRLREAVEELQSDGRAILMELRQIQAQGGNPTEVESRRQEFDGFYVVGNLDTSDIGQALAAHRTACDQVETKLREVFGGAFDVFVCGDSKNVTQYPSINYYRFASTPKVSVRFRSANPLRAIPAGDVAGQVDSASAYDAWASWWGSCKTFLDGQKGKYGDRFVAAECGKPRNVTAYPSIHYQKLLSTGTVYLLD